MAARDPIWEYIMNTLVARINLDHFETRWCFVGHSHFQAVLSTMSKLMRCPLRCLVWANNMS